MSRLLVTRLPQELQEVVSGDTYNRLIRILEINLGEFDPDNTRQINSTERDQVNFNPGSLIWNTSNQALEVWNGRRWVTLPTPEENHGFEATASVGVVSVKTNGDITITL